MLTEAATARRAIVVHFTSNMFSRARYFLFIPKESARSSCILTLIATANASVWEGFHETARSA
jgi:hypothetical protein